MHFVIWAQAHYAQALLVAAFVATTLGSLRNLLTQLGAISSAAGGRLAKAADWLAWIAEHGKLGPFGGWLSLPGVTSKAPTLPQSAAGKAASER